MSTDYAKDRWIEGRQKRVERQEAEIERLQEENEELKRPRCDADHAAEIERLRKLLFAIEAMGYLVPGFESSSDHRAICKEWRRICEELGYNHD